MTSQQFFVVFNGRTHVLDAAKSSPATASSLLTCLRRRLWPSVADASAAALATASWRLQYAGRFVAPEAEVPAAPSVVHVFTGGLLGGKGGFGAMLRSMAKQAGKKPTRDFGACRDLQGRRLRHVNDEVSLRKWRDAQEAKARRGKIVDEDDDEPPEERTPSGIAGWHLGVPSWAEGIKIGQEKTSYMKPRRKTGICRDWTAARASGRRPPEGAPPWWGCPRGRNCDFAHGEEDLRGVGLKEHRKRTREDSAQERRLGQEGYVAASSAPDVLEGMADAVAQGLLAARSASKSRALAAAAGARDSSTDAAADLEVADDSGRLLEMQGEEELLAAGGAGFDGSALAELDEASRSGCSWMKLLAGELALGENGRAEGVSGFGSARVSGVSLTGGRHYYEAWLLTPGTEIIQLGWADEAFKVGPEVDDGVGDNVHSWAYDGARQRCWNGTDREFGEAWAQGDVIGCLLDLDAGTMSFRLNGKDLGVAFTNVLGSDGAANVEEAEKGGRPAKKAKSSSSSDSAARRGFYPAFSVTQGEAIMMQVRNGDFSFPLPEGCAAVGDSMRGAAVTAAPLSAAPNGTAKEREKSEEIPAMAVGSSGEQLAEKTNTASDKSSASQQAPHEQANGGEERAASTSSSAAATAPGGADENVSVGPLDLMKFDTPTALLEFCGPERVKLELTARGAKVGGTPYERAVRLHSLRGLSPEEYPEKVLAAPPKAKNKKKT